MVFVLFIKPKAEKALDKLPEDYRLKVRNAFVSILTNPFSGKKLSGDKKGQCSIRVWPYRIVYRIEKQELVIIVIDIEHRQSVYNK